MATFYIPYVVGSSAIAYIGKEMVSYLYREDSLEKIEIKEENSFLKNENEIIPSFDIIENEENKELPKYSSVPTYDSIDREYQIREEIVVEPEETVEPEEKKKIINKNVTFLINDSKIDNYNDSIDKSKTLKSFKPQLTIIEEEKETIDLKLELPKKLFKCAKCTSFLPLKCFSKTQKKKTPKVWKCKVCLKLN